MSVNHGYIDEAVKQKHYDWQLLFFNFFFTQKYLVVVNSAFYSLLKMICCPPSDVK